MGVVSRRFVPSSCRYFANISGVLTRSGGLVSGQGFVISGRNIVFPVPSLNGQDASQVSSVDCIAMPKVKEEQHVPP